MILETEEEHRRIEKMIDASVNEKLMAILKTKTMETFVVPPFRIRHFEEHEKLTGHNNYKKWVDMVHLDLCALSHKMFITSPCGESEEEIPPTSPVQMDAQTLQYLKATPSKSIRSHLDAIFTAYEASEKLKSMYGGGRLRDFIYILEMTFSTTL